MLRFVIDPSGVVTPDLAGELPGRGAWVTANRSALEEAIKRGAFARSFKTGAKTPEALAETVEQGLVKAALNALGLARRVGDAAAGFDQVKRLLKDGDATVLAAAREGGEDGKRKLKALAKGAFYVDAFSSPELSKALGRDGVVHVALKKGPAAERFKRAAARLEGFRSAPALVKS